jgi:transposase
MINFASAALKVYLAAVPTDMRKSFNGLCAIAQDHIGETRLHEALFVFCNKRKNRLKILYYDRTGLWVATKRLEQGTFSWPASTTGSGKISLTPEALQLLVDGVDLKGARMRPWYERDD